MTIHVKTESPVRLVAAIAIQLRHGGVPILGWVRQHRLTAHSWKATVIKRGAAGRMLVSMA